MYGLACNRVHHDEAALEHDRIASAGTSVAFQSLKPPGVKIPAFRAFVPRPLATCVCKSLKACWSWPRWSTNPSLIHTHSAEVHAQPLCVQIGNAHAEELIKAQRPILACIPHSVELIKAPHQGFPN